MWALLIALLVLLLSTSSLGDEVPVPSELQAKLLAKVAEYDRNFAARAGDRVHILLAFKSGSSDSEHVVQQMRGALSELGPLAGLPHDERIVPYTGTEGLLASIKSQHAAIVFFGSDFGDEVERIRDALQTTDVLTVASVPGYVPRGIVLGFDLVSGKPKLLVHLTQAKKQHVDFSAEILKIMKVYE